MSIQIYPQLNMLLPRVVRDIFIYCCEKGTIKNMIIVKDKHIVRISTC